MMKRRLEHLLRKVKRWKVFVPQELIFSRINEKNRFNPCQPGKKIPFRWTTGAGPRIGCVRDYPSPLQFRALEQVNLSPRGTGGSGQNQGIPCSHITEISSAAKSCREIIRNNAMIDRRDQ
ncbi:putative IQ domain-containing protein IQM [Dioscorea sansibarensis]